MKRRRRNEEEGNEENEEEGCGGMEGGKQGEHMGAKRDRTALNHAWRRVQKIDRWGRGGVREKEEEEGEEGDEGERRGVEHMGAQRDRTVLSYSWRSGKKKKEEWISLYGEVCVLNCICYKSLE